MTVTVTKAECLIVVWLVLVTLKVYVPVMLMSYVPGWVEPAIEIINPVLMLFPDSRLMALLVQLPLIPEVIELLFERFMVPLVSFILVRVIDKLLFFPVWMLRLVGLAEMVKLSSKTEIVTVSTIALTLPELSVV